MLFKMNASAAAAMWFSLFVGMLLLVSCAAERQGVVCDEIEYRLNTMAYSPDQRAFEEQELEACRADEAQKKGEAKARRESIYERFAASDSTKKDSAKVAPDGSIVMSDEPREVSVSEALKDSSGVETTSIYDRYGAVNKDSVSAEKDSVSEGAAP